MLIGIFTILGIKTWYLVILGLTESLLLIIHENSLLILEIIFRTEACSSEIDKYFIYMAI